MASPYTLPDPNANAGLDISLAYIASQTPFMFPMILFFIFCAITIIGYMYEETRFGRKNIFQWLCLASLTTTLGAFILYLIPNVLDLFTLGICVAFTILFTLLFLFSDRE